MSRDCAVILAIAPLLCGCVGTLETRPNREFTRPDAALAGISYALPKVRYEVALTRTLAECPGEVVDGKPTALRFSIGATATATFVAGESYSVEYRKLPGFLRTGNFELKLYPNGTLKSIGAGAEDKTGDVLDSVAKTALSIATIVGLSGGDESTIKPPTAIVLCTPETAELVKEARDLEVSLKGKATLLESYEKISERLRAAGAARLIDEQGREDFLGLFDDIREVEGGIEVLKRRQSELKELLGVSDKAVWNGSVVEDSYNEDYILTEGQASKIAALLKVGATPAEYPTDSAESKRRGLMTACYGSEAETNTCVDQQLNLRSGVYLDRGLPECGSDGADATECLNEVSDGDQYHAARDNIPDSGIFVREAMIGRLLFCRKVFLQAAVGAQRATTLPAVTTNSDGTLAGGMSSTGTTSGQLEGGDENVQQGGQIQIQAQTVAAEPKCDVAHDEAKIAAGDFPQFGQLRYLPLRVGTFQAREMAISLTEAGHIDTFTYKSTKAPAQVAASTAAGIASQYQAFLEARETERRSDAEYLRNQDLARRVDVKYARDEEIALLDQQIGVLTQQAQLLKLQAPPEVDALQPIRDETAAIQADLALKKAKLDRLKTERELAALE